jgi:hypothetical protein
VDAELGFVVRLVTWRRRWSHSFDAVEWLEQQRLLERWG